MKLIKLLLTISILIGNAFSSILYSNQSSNVIVANWTFDEMSGNTLYDISGNQNNGVIWGAQWAELDSKNSLQFDGADDYVQVADNSSQDITKMTLEAILYLNDATKGGVISKWGEGGLADSYILYVSGSYLYAKIVRDGIAGQTTVQSTSTLPLGQWIHVAATYDGESLKLYINCQLEGEVNASGTISQTNNDLLLGLEEIMYNTHNYLNGYISKARISSGALNPPEFLSIFLTQVGEDKGNKLLSEYRLSQNYPNPFNQSTCISYSIPSSTFVTLKVFDLLGREIKTLVSEYKERGNYSIKFDSEKLVSGLYFYVLQSGEFDKTKKMLLVK